MPAKKAIEFETNLYNLINSCGLPVDTAFYVLKSVYIDFQRTLENMKEKEAEEETTKVQEYNLLETNNDSEEE